jgi:hypothetical protein
MNRTLFHRKGAKGAKGREENRELVATFAFLCFSWRPLRSLRLCGESLGFDYD